ncbi:DUF1989 domain-containing protein [Halalkalibacter hemicellulosilyticus]|uniref:DUF1989 domain-containing protein n=1 Tax=Halalkalibacter hemicellulosilyticusJCM 9152 TaxID=1236971 RepID=W4QC27_9BACI|nr:urea carboxylase-associated family protein [Halalkalibacter hemicellulosilyticus]GAE28909.1 hypothetical protein JCM9152_247 [Halalkalibacter hemicellulosilyticusJCM 9152]
MYSSFTIAAKTGHAFYVKKGTIMTIINIEGHQIADLVAYNDDDYQERLDSAATRDAYGSLTVSEGNHIYSNYYRPMITILEDPLNTNDLVSPACRPEMYQLLFNKDNNVKSCYENLKQAFSSFNIPQADQYYPFNLFMNTVVDKQNKMTVKPSPARAGEFIRLVAKMNLVVGISVCPNEDSPGNGYHSSPIKVELS